MKLGLLLMLIEAVTKSLSIGSTQGCPTYDSFPFISESKVVDLCNRGNCRPQCVRQLCEALNSTLYNLHKTCTQTITHTYAVDHTPSEDICTTVTVTKTQTVSYSLPNNERSLCNCSAYPTNTPITTTSSSLQSPTAVDVGSENTGLAVLGSFTVLLALLLVVTITGWIYTAMISRRKHKSINATSKKGGTRDGIHNPVYGTSTLTGSDNQSVVQCNTQAPEYERVAIDNTNGYDVIDRRVPRPPPVSHTHNNESTDQDYSVLDSEGIEHDYHVLENPAGGGPISGGGVQDYEVPLPGPKSETIETESN